MFDGGLVSLFFGSLLASTLVPGGVEGLLYFMVDGGEHALLSLLIVASTGNTLGGIITWAIGYFLQHRFLPFAVDSTGQSDQKPEKKGITRWFTLTPGSMKRVRKWGTPALLMSWMPVIGDPLCLAAGFLRFSFWPCLLMIAAGKFARYITLIWLLDRTVGPGYP